MELWADQDTLMECDQLRFIFYIVPLAIHTSFPRVLLCLDLIDQKSHQQPSYKLFSPPLFFHKIHTCPVNWGCRIY